MVWAARDARRRSNRPATMSPHCRAVLTAAQPHIAVMPRIDDPSRRPERPRVEPEIIPPRRGRPAGNSGIWFRVEENADGIRRVHLKQPSPLSIMLVLLAAGLVVALVLLLLAGLMLIWIPLVIAGILFAIFAVSARTYWRRLRTWWGGRSVR